MSNGQSEKGIQGYNTLKEAIKERKEWTNQLLAKFSDGDRLVNKLENETYVSMFGSEKTFGTELHKAVDDLVEKESKSHENKIVTGVQEDIKIPRRKVTEFSVKILEDEDVLGNLTSRLSDIQEAMDVYNKTHDSKEEKFKYMLTHEKYNEHLVSLDYFDDMFEYIQGKLDTMCEEIGVKYFKVKAVKSQFIGRGRMVVVFLSHPDVPDVTMFTKIELNKKEIAYPNQLGVNVTGFRVSNTPNKEYLTNHFNYLNERLGEQEKEYASLVSGINSLASGVISSYVHSKGIEGLEKEKSYLIESILGNAVEWERIKETLKKQLLILDKFDKGLSGILHEQHIIMSKLGELLGKDVRFKDEGFHN